MTNKFRADSWSRRDWKKAWSRSGPRKLGSATPLVVIHISPTFWTSWYFVLNWIVKLSKNYISWHCLNLDISYWQESYSFSEKVYSKITTCILSMIRYCILSMRDLLYIWDYFWNLLPMDVCNVSWRHHCSIFGKASWKFAANIQTKMCFFRVGTGCSISDPYPFCTDPNLALNLMTHPGPGCVLTPTEMRFLIISQFLKQQSSAKVAAL